MSGLLKSLIPPWIVTRKVTFKSVWITESDSQWSVGGSGLKAIVKIKQILKMKLKIGAKSAVTAQKSSRSLFVGTFSSKY